MPDRKNWFLAFGPALVIVGWMLVQSRLRQILPVPSVESHTSDREIH
jgi:hypothetical protein